MESQKISKHTDTKDDRDFDFLRGEGLEHIREMSRKIWTDYNSHDPGITILETLCYAITDLGNRLQLPIRDLLTTSKEAKGNLTGNFPSAKSILTTKAVTERDYRKLMIDINGVKNAFIHANTSQNLHRLCLDKSEPGEGEQMGKLSYKPSNSHHYKTLDSFTLKGLYNIYFEPDHDIQLLGKESVERKTRIKEITDQVKSRYHANRNLCEDLVTVQEANYLDILVCGDIQIERTSNAAAVMAEIMFRVKEYLSPAVKRFSLEELLDQNLEVDFIFDGPILENGFVPDQELEKTAIKRELYLSDLIRIVTEVPGVKSIKKLKMGLCNGDEISAEIEEKSKQKWKICLPDDEVLLPRLCLKASVTRTNLFKDVIPVPPDYDVVIEKLNERIAEHEKSISLSYDDLPTEKGEYAEIENYRTVQNDLPQLYGTGEFGLSPSLPPDRHSKAKQLKSYLLFFDQILATYFGHLRNVGVLLSSVIGTNSYFANGISGVKDFDDLIKNSASYSSDVQEILESHDDFNHRKSVFLDHLLARFSENMNEYAFAMLDGFGENLTNAALWHKSVLLNEYAELSSDRAQAFNYFSGESNAWNTFDVSGFKHRIGRLLGIRNYSRRNLTDQNFEIFFDEDTGNWHWTIFDEESKPLISGKSQHLSESKTETDLWNTVSLGWNSQNYIIRPGENENEFLLAIINSSKEEIARVEKFFSSEAEASQQIKILTEYLFNHVSDEGLFLFEHILFLPDENDGEADAKMIKICMDSDCAQCKPDDPYSFRLTIILPGWTSRFSNLYFREYAENVIRREVPAHILCRICWIGNAIESEEGEWSTDDGPMQQLQDLYQKWITKKMQSPENQEDNEFLKPLVDLLHDLETVYPEGKLFDCKTGESDDSDSSIVLGKSTIGELKNKKNGDE